MHRPFRNVLAEPEETQLSQLRELVEITHISLQLALALTIAARGGAHPPNVALALALVFVFGSDSWQIWDIYVWPDSRLIDAGSIVVFYLGASFYIRAAQRFPRTIEPADIAASPTIWGRIKVLRAVVTILLRPWVLWLVTACLTALVAMQNVYVAELARIAVVLLGIL